jgi:hypothetical protein
MNEAWRKEGPPKRAASRTQTAPHPNASARRKVQIGIKSSMRAASLVEAPTCGNRFRLLPRRDTLPQKVDELLQPPSCGEAIVSVISANLVLAQ